MGSIVILMMTVVALGIVFADDKDKEGCPCNPQPPVTVAKEIEDTEGNIRPLNTCMRTWIEYRNCSPKQWTWKIDKCVLVEGFWGGLTAHVICEGTWTQQCDKYRV